MEIDAKIATLLSDIRLAVNVGSLAGVAKGDQVVLFQTITVKDPDSGEPLGEVKLTTLRMSIEDVQERLAVAVVPNESISISRMMTQIVTPKRIASLTDDPFNADSSKVLAARGQSVVVILKSTGTEG